MKRMLFVVVVIIIFVIVLVVLINNYSEKRLSPLKKQTAPLKISELKQYAVSGQEAQQFLNKVNAEFDKLK